MNIQISRRNLLRGTIAGCSGESDSGHKADSVLSEAGSWITRKSDTPQHEFLTIDYKEIADINHVSITAGHGGTSLLPADFRIEGSVDNAEWCVLHEEKNFQTDDTTYLISIPIVSIRYLKLFISRSPQKDGKYFSEIGKITAGIEGIRDTSVSSSSSSDKNASQLFDGKPDTCWESSMKTSAAKETADIDLGQVYMLSRLVVQTPKAEGFPENFSVQASSDKKVWVQLFEEKKFKAEKGHTYSWPMDAVNARYIKFEALSVKTAEEQYCCRVAGLAVYASPVDDAHSHTNAGNPPHASIFQGGLVRLAKDGEDTKGAAVQANDRRLRDGSTLFKGIVQLADNGETKENLVLQSTDDRIKPATDTRAGIVRLAYDGERKAGSVVQGNDSRLKEATENSNGIVRLCPDGAYSETGVVKGNDARLKNAAVNAAGIVRLADDGETNANCAVQGNDRRLRDASTTAKGIVELAEDGESKPGTVVQGNDKRLKDATVLSKGIVELAEDGEDKDGVAVQGSDRRLKDATTVAKGIVELAEDGENKSGVAVQGNDKRLKDATTVAKGIVELAEDGEDRQGAVVQGNDKRLKDATEQTKGILRFASDGEISSNAAVQGNDRRLKDATTVSKGIVELAENGEVTPGTAVQGNDARLKDATTVSKGIVELAENGEDKDGVAVQGNDKRLKDATEHDKGIMRFAVNGESASNTAVQGNDKRLKDATEHDKGIMRFASDGEISSNTAVQGNDKRLKDATTVSKGIVELAENGEDRSGVAVQADDTRLKPADEENTGIVRFAKDGEKRKSLAVQADDSRLSDKREPLSHTHDYAPLNHAFDSHTGTIAVSGERSQDFTGITPPPHNGAVIYAENRSEARGAAGISAVVNATGKKTDHSYGVIAHSPFVGVRGQSAGNSGDVKGAGILGVSRFGAGGVFSSEHEYSLVVDGFGKIGQYDNTLKLNGSGKAMLVQGDSVIHGSISLSRNAGKEEHPAALTDYFTVDNQDFISAGDILAVSETGESILKRSQNKYQKSVIGIVSGNPALALNNSGAQEKIYPVVLCGKTLCKVDARNTPILPGDLIVTSDTPGCGMKGKIDSFDKIGTVVGKALEGLSEGIGTIAVFVTHQ